MKSLGRLVSVETQFNERTVYAQTRPSGAFVKWSRSSIKLNRDFGSVLIAFAWYRSEPLPGFSGQTAMQLVKSGRADEVLEYIDAVDAGIYA